LRVCIKIEGANAIKPLRSKSLIVSIRTIEDFVKEFQ